MLGAGFRRVYFGNTTLKLITGTKESRHNSTQLEAPPGASPKLRILVDTPEALILERKVLM